MFASNFRKSSSNRRRAQGMTEYIIIIALVSVALITIVTLFGNKIKFLFASSVASLDNGKVEDPKSVFEEQTLKEDLGEDQVNKDNVDKSSTIKHFKSGDGE